MKNRHTLMFAALLTAAALFSPGCATLDPGQQIALANAAAGNAVATYLLNKQGQAAVQPLQDLAAKLPMIVEGKVSAYQLGQLNAELKGVQAGAVGNQQLIDQAGSLIALISQSASAATGGAITPQQAVLLGYAQDVSTGIANAVQYWNGGHGGPAPQARAGAGILPSYTLN